MLPTTDNQLAAMDRVPTKLAANVGARSDDRLGVSPFAFSVRLRLLRNRHTGLLWHGYGPGGARKQEGIRCLT